MSDTEKERPQFDLIKGGSEIAASLDEVKFVLVEGTEISIEIYPGMGPEEIENAKRHAIIHQQVLDEINGVTRDLPAIEPAEKSRSEGNLTSIRDRKPWLNTDPELIRRTLRNFYKKAQEMRDRQSNLQETDLPDNISQFPTHKEE